MTEESTDLATLSDEDFKKNLAELLTLAQEERKSNQLLQYVPVSAVGFAVHESQARVLGIGGGNGCQVAGTRVITGRGMIPIEEVVVGDTVPGRHKHPGRVTALYTSPTIVPCYRVTTKRGYTMVASGDHMNMIATGRYRAWHNASDADWKTAEWVRLDLLAKTFHHEQFYIHMSTGGGFPSRSKITEDDAFFLGLMVGDGHYGAKANRMSYTTNDEDVVLIKWMKDYLTHRGVHCSVSHKNQSNGTAIQWCNANFVKWIESVGVKRCLGPEKTVPESVWRGSQNIVAAFIKGFADSDGCATTKPSVVFINRSTELMRGVHILLRRFGINASRRFTESDGHIKRPNGIWRLEVAGVNALRYAKFIGFMSPQKMARLPKREPSKKPPVQARWDRIVSVERVEDQTVYGLTISPKPHYQADGFLQHNSGKSELALLEIVMAATGVFPDSLKHLAKQKWRGPIAARIILESLTTTLYPVILPKLQHFKWSGVDQPGGERGHWGWIPKWCLIDGIWEKSWTDKLRTLRVLCRDPEDLNRVVGESTITFMSKDQDPSDFASGDFHLIMHDEPPTLAIWRESQARTMRVAGRMIVAMTWPDDPAIPVDWIFDEVYEPGMAKERGIEWFNIYTTDNRNLDQAAVAMQAGDWSTETRNVRLYGQPIRFSNRVHPHFTDHTAYWCFTCGKTCIAKANEKTEHTEDKWSCESCGSIQVCEFNHVKEFEATDKWPTVWLLDPHPRRPHIYIWAMCDPSDDWWIVADGACEGDPVETKKDVDRVERGLMLNVVHRVMDPNMALSPASSKRGVNWRDEFDSAGLVCSLADDSHVGRERLNQYLKPDSGRWQPRIHIHPRCKATIFGIKRYVWQDRKLGSERALLQIPKDKNDDEVNLLKYLMNESVTFAQLAGMNQHYQRKGRKGAY